jgi:hypothetical protein
MRGFSEIFPPQKKLIVEVECIMNNNILLHFCSQCQNKAALGFVNRQSSYHRLASEILGLVSRDKNGGYKLSDRREDYLDLCSQRNRSSFANNFLSYP